ncbi:MAG: hypothetical protein M3375_05575 [Actinomycetota bacterium]|nr:hypothetical protein [Actinomycetota bacterium]
MSGGDAWLAYSHRAARDAVRLGADAYYQNAERAFRHLEVSAALAARASVQQVHSGPGVTATATAAAIEHRLELLD